MSLRWQSEDLKHSHPFVALHFPTSQARTPRWRSSWTSHPRPSSSAHRLDLSHPHILRLPYPLGFVSAIDFAPMSDEKVRIKKIKVGKRLFRPAVAFPCPFGSRARNLYVQLAALRPSRGCDTSLPTPLPRSSLSPDGCQEKKKNILLGADGPVSLLCM